MSTEPDPSVGLTDTTEAPVGPAIENIQDVAAIPCEEVPASGSPTGKLPTTAFGHSYLTMFTRFLQKTYDAIQAGSGEKLLWFTWSNKSKGRNDVRFFVDIKKDGDYFRMEMGIPNDVRKMTFNFQVTQKGGGSSIALMRRNYSQEEHPIHTSGLLWLFKVDNGATTFADNPFRNAISRTSWLLDFMNRLHNGNNKPVEVSLTFNENLTEEWKHSFNAAIQRLLSGQDEDNNAYWTHGFDVDTDITTLEIMAHLEKKFAADGDSESHEMAMVFFASLILRWVTFAVDTDPIPGFPQNDDMHNVRPVDLNPYDVNADLQARGLNYPYQVIIAACSALNAGKHLILSGPPGNGKTELAIQLAKIAGVSLITATANPSWTTAEMMGRYMPKDRGGLEFVPGYFLAAIENSNEKKWLLIDEFNRADIDTCMGELFTVLSNQAVVLPFRAHEEDTETGVVSEAGSVVAKRIAVIPTTTAEQDLTFGNRNGTDTVKRPRQFDTAPYKTYVVPPEFRIIATMNDSDASRLNPLSFALRRRFVILRVEAPAMKKRRELISQRLDATIRAENMESSFYGVKHLRTTIAEKFKDNVGELLFGLFAAEDMKVSDLLDMRLIGVGQVFDVIDFIKEGLRAPNAGDSSVANAKLDFSQVSGRQDNIKHLIASYAALAIEMMVFPQLDACDDVNFESAVRLVANTFSGFDFLVVDAPDKEPSGRPVDSYNVRVHDRYPTINRYLADKLKSQYSYQPDRLETVEKVFRTGDES